MCAGSSAARSPPPRFGADGALFSYPTTFYPTARLESEAVPIAVAAGEERGGVNFALKPVRTVRVSGTLVSTDAPVAHRPLQLLPLGADGTVGERPIARAMTDANGAFTFIAVPAGEYLVHFLKEPTDGEFGFVEAISMEMTGAIVLTDRASRSRNRRHSPRIRTCSGPATMSSWPTATHRTDTHDAPGHSRPRQGRD